MGKKKEEIINEEINNNELISEDSDVANKEFKEEMCLVLWKKSNAFAIDFKGYGISFHVKDNHIFDFDKIGNYIKVRYCEDIGSPLFEIQPIYE